MIITVGFSEAEITKEAALANPDVQFAIVDMVITADNGDLLLDGLKIMEQNLLLVLLLENFPKLAM